MTDAVTPRAGITFQVATAGTAVQVAPGAINGGYIVNPYSALDQNIPVAEVLYIDAVGQCGGTVLPKANGSVLALQPGQTYNLIPGQTTPTWANAGTSGHLFTVVIW